MNKRIILSKDLVDVRVYDYLTLYGCKKIEIKKAWLPTIQKTEEFGVLILSYQEIESTSPNQFIFIPVASGIGAFVSELTVLRWANANIKFNSVIEQIKNVLCYELMNLGNHECIIETDDSLLYPSYLNLFMCLRRLKDYYSFPSEWVSKVFLHHSLLSDYQEQLNELMMEEKAVINIPIDFLSILEKVELKQEFIYKKKKYCFSDEMMQFLHQFLNSSHLVPYLANIGIWVAQAFVVAETEQLIVSERLVNNTEKITSQEYWDKIMSMFNPISLFTETSPIFDDAKKQILWNLDDLFGIFRYPGYTPECYSWEEKDLINKEIARINDAFAPYISLARQAESEQKKAKWRKVSMSRNNDVVNRYDNINDPFEYNKKTMGDMMRRHFWELTDDYKKRVNSSLYMEVLY